MVGVFVCMYDEYICYYRYTSVRCSILPAFWSFAAACTGSISGFDTPPTGNASNNTTAVTAVLEVWRVAGFDALDAACTYARTYFKYGTTRSMGLDTLDTACA